jgi:hypothetical protein
LEETATSSILSRATQDGNGERDTFQRQNGKGKNGKTKYHIAEPLVSSLAFAFA